MGVFGSRTEDSCGREEKKSSGLEEEPEKEMGDLGVRLSPVMVTGRQKRDASVEKRVKASWSSVETV